MTDCLFRLIWYARRGRQSRPIRLENISPFFHLRSPSGALIGNLLQRGQNEIEYSLQSISIHLPRDFVGVDRFMT